MKGLFDFLSMLGFRSRLLNIRIAREVLQRCPFFSSAAFCCGSPAVENAAANLSSAGGRAPEGLNRSSSVSLLGPFTDPVDRKAFGSNLRLAALRFHRAESTLHDPRKEKKHRTEIRNPPPLVRLRRPVQDW